MRLPWRTVPFRLHLASALVTLPVVFEGWPSVMRPEPWGNRGGPRGRMVWLQLRIRAAGLLAAGSVLAVADASAPPDPLSPAERSWVAERGALRYAVDSEFAPVEFARADGTVAGVVPDLVAQIARNLQVTIHAVRCPSAAEAYRAVQDGQADFGTTSALDAALRDRFDFTAPCLFVPGHWLEGGRQARAQSAIDGSTAAEASGESSLYLHVAKGNRTLLAILDKGIASLSDSQRQAALRRWTLPGTAVRPAGSVQPAVLISLLVLTGLLVFAPCRFFFRRSLARLARASAENIAQHEAAESILRRSHEHWQALMRNAPLGSQVYRLHADGRLMLAETNPAADRCLGLGPSSMVGLPLDEVVPGWRGTELMDSLRRLAREGGVTLHQQIADPQGRGDRAYELQAFQTLPGRVAVFLTDVTERQQAEDARRQRVATLTMILNALPQWVFWKDTQGYYLGCNRAFALGVGFETPAALVGKTDFDLPWSPREAEAQRADDLQVIEQNRHQHYARGALPLADGTYLSAEILKVPLTNAAGEPLGLLGVGHDITESTRIQQSLQEARQTVQAALDSLPLRVGWKDRNLGYLGANRSFAVAAGVAGPEELVGRNDFDLRWRSEAENLRTDDRRVLETGEALASRVVSESTADGREIWIQKTKIPLRDPAGQVTGVLEIGEDITERRQAEAASEARLGELARLLDGSEAEAEAVRRQLDALTHALHLDLHAPLRAIEGYAGMLAQDHGEGFNPEGLRLMDVLQRETRRMGQVIQTLLDQHPDLRRRLSPGHTTG